MDMALHLITELENDLVAKTIQLINEYNSQPLYDCGHPLKASEGVIALAKDKLMADAKKELKSSDYLKYGVEL